MAAQNGQIQAVDRRILEILQRQGRIPNVQLAEKVGLSPPAVLERVRKLEERGIISGYAALVDNRRVGFGTLAFVAVSLNLHHKDSIEKFHAFVAGSESVRECYHVAGSEDYLLKVMARDIDDYEQFLLRSLTRTEGIDRVKTMFVLSTLKREIGVPIEAGAEEEENGTRGTDGTNRKNGRGNAKGGGNG